MTSLIIIIKSTIIILFENVINSKKKNPFNYQKPNPKILRSPIKLGRYKDTFVDFRNLQQFPFPVNHTFKIILKRFFQ